MTPERMKHDWVCSKYGIVEHPVPNFGYMSCDRCRRKVRSPGASPCAMCERPLPGHPADHEYIEKPDDDGTALRWCVLGLAVVLAVIAFFAKGFVVALGVFIAAISFFALAMGPD